jgi:hypothetical protein
LLYKIGLYASISKSEGSGFNKTGTYIRCNVNKETSNKIILKNIRKKEYNGKIYCVEVPNGTLYVKYKGKSFWFGNCVAEQDHLFQAFQVFSIMEWDSEFRLNLPIQKKKHCKSGV